MVLVESTVEDDEALLPPNGELEGLNLDWVDPFADVANDPLLP